MNFIKSMLQTVDNYWSLFCFFAGIGVAFVAVFAFAGIVLPVALYGAYLILTMKREDEPYARQYGVALLLVTILAFGGASYYVIEKSPALCTIGDNQEVVGDYPITLAAVLHVFVPRDSYEHFMHHKCGPVVQVTRYRYQCPKGTTFYTENAVTTDDDCVQTMDTYYKWWQD